MAGVAQKVGTFALNTSLGNQAITGLGFQPKAVIFMMTPNTSDIDSPDLTANNYGTMGITDGTRQFTMSWMTPNGAGLEAACFAQADDRCGIGIVSTNTIDFSFSIVSLDADGFTINVDDTGGGAWQVGYLAIGGDDVEAYVGDLTAKTGSIGTQAETGVGFQPDALFMMTASHTVYANNSAVDSDASISYGFSDGTDDRSLGFWLRDGEVIVGQRHSVHRNDSVLCPLSSDSAYNFRCDVDSLDADGFTLNFPDIGNADDIMYLALRGVSFKVGNFTLPTSTGVTTAVDSLAFEPGTVMVLSTGHQSLNLISSNGDGVKWIAGFATGADERYSIGGTDQDNLSSPATNCDHYQHSQHLGRIGNYSQAIEEQFDLADFGDGGFDIDAENVVASSPSVVSYLAIEGTFDSGGDNPGTGSGGDSSPDASFFFLIV